MIVIKYNIRFKLIIIKFVCHKEQNQTEPICKIKKIEELLYQSSMEYFLSYTNIYIRF